MKNYTEIFKLKEMLEKAEIPFEFREMTMQNGYQIGYPCLKEKDRICSCVEHSFSYGNEEDKLEIMGLLTDVEQAEDVGDEYSVKGYLTAEEVYKRIYIHYKAVSKC
jgi:hypothetical protein